MGIISTILNLLGCSDQTKETKSNLSKEMDEQISKSIEAFNNRPIYKVLTEKNIDTTSDENLLQVIFDNLSEKLPNDYNKEYETVKSWNKSRQAIYMIWILEGEVNNGGFNQFYANPSGQFSQHLPEALEIVGANKFSSLAQNANELYDKEKKKITKHQDGTLEGFSKSYEDNPLEKYDTEFYELYKTENLQKIQVNYIRNNKKDFID